MKSSKYIFLFSLGPFYYPEQMLESPKYKKNYITLKHYSLNLSPYCMDSEISEKYFF